MKPFSATTFLFIGVLFVVQPAAAGESVEPATDVMTGQEATTPAPVPEEPLRQLETVVVEDEAEAREKMKLAAARMAEIRNCATSTGSRLRGNRNCRAVGTVSRDDMMNQGPFTPEFIREVAKEMNPGGN